MKERDHFELGWQHGLNNTPRYKWQDPYLQKYYDQGYDHGQRMLRENKQTINDYVPGTILQNYRRRYQ